MTSVTIPWTGINDPDDPALTCTLFGTYDDVTLEAQSGRCVNNMTVVAHPYITDGANRLTNDVAPGGSRTWNLPKNRYFMVMDPDLQVLTLPAGVFVGF